MRDKKKPYFSKWLKIIQETTSKRLKVKKIRDLVKTKDFSDYLECTYKHCFSEYITVLKKQLSSSILLNKIKDINYYNKNLKNKYKKILNDIKLITDDNYVKIIGNIIIFQAQID